MALAVRRAMRDTFGSEGKVSAIGLGTAALVGGSPVVIADSSIGEVALNVRSLL